MKGRQKPSRPPSESFSLFVMTFLLAHILFNGAYFVMASQHRAGPRREMCGPPTTTNQNSQPLVKSRGKRAWQRPDRLLPPTCASPLCVDAPYTRSCAMDGLWQLVYAPSESFLEEVSWYLIVSAVFVLVALLTIDVKTYGKFAVRSSPPRGGCARASYDVCTAVDHRYPDSSTSNLVSAGASVLCVVGSPVALERPR